MVAFTRGYTAPLLLMPSIAFNRVPSKSSLSSSSSKRLSRVLLGALSASAVRTYHSAVPRVVPRLRPPYRVLPEASPCSLGASTTVAKASSHPTVCQIQSCNTTNEYFKCTRCHPMRLVSAHHIAHTQGFSQLVYMEILHMQEAAVIVCRGRSPAHALRRDQDESSL